MSRVVRTGLPIAMLSGLVLVPLSATAHIEITSHTDRFGSESQKQAPCGLAGGSGPGGTVYTYEPGETISIAWHEYIDHPGHYRIAFDEQGDDDFPTPTSADDLYPNATVLIDDIPDQAGVHDYTVDITFPDLECEQCTIQVIQVMTDKPPFGDGNDVYFHCIDVRLQIGGGEVSREDSDSTDGCACSTGSPGSPGSPAAPASLALFGLFALGRRTRRVS